LEFDHLKTKKETEDNIKMALMEIDCDYREKWLIQLNRMYIGRLLKLAIQYKVKHMRTEEDHW